MCPLPHKGPIPEFQKVGIEFTMAKELDRLVFENLANLYGFKRIMKDGETQYIVVFENQGLERSQKISMVP